MNTECPTSRDGLHHYTYSVGSGLKADFEPVEYGKSAEDTLYRRVESSMLACSCGLVLKQRIVMKEDA